MDIISLLVTIIVIVAIIAVFRWFLTSSGVAIPQPLVIVAYAVIAIIAILFLAQYIGVYHFGAPGFR